MSDQAFSRRIAGRVVEELATALGTAIARELHAEPSAGPAAGQGWQLAIEVSGGRSGAIDVWLDAAGASSVAGIVTGEAEPSEGDVGRLLQELGTQATATVALLSDYAGMHVALSHVAPAVAPQGGAFFRIPLPGGAGVLVSASADVGAASKGAAPVADAPRPLDDPQGGRNPNLDVVLDVELPLIVRFGRTVMSLKALSTLGPGSIVDMGRSPDDAVELMVSDQVIAYGEVVIVDGNYGLRITDLVSRADRIRASLEA